MRRLLRSLRAAPPGMANTEALHAAYQCLAEKLAEGRRVLDLEFERLRRAGPPEEGTAAVAWASSAKNRYINVLPYDFNRVLLLGGQDDYVNASLLSSRPDEVPAWSYIATQGPLPSTVEDFWRMLYENRCPAIVMLTRCVENGSIVKCAEYLPAEVGTMRAFGAFVVGVVACDEVTPDVRRCQVTLTYRKTGEVRQVVHFHCLAWPDHGTPASTLPLRLLARHLAALASPGSGPPVVHCSAGIGRTGTFCAVDIVLRRLRALPPGDTAAARAAVNIKRTVLHLRKQRAGMVQTAEQYLFCYQAVAEELAALLGLPPWPGRGPAPQLPAPAGRRV